MYSNIFSIPFSLLDPLPIHINGKFLTPKVTTSTVMVRNATVTSLQDLTLSSFPMAADNVLITQFLLLQDTLQLLLTTKQKSLL